MINKSEAEISPVKFKEYVSSLIKGDRKACLNYVKEYIRNNTDYIQLYEEVLKQSLYEVGEMWESNKITVASEHLATSITELLLNHVYEQSIFPDKAGKKIILTCAEKEEHQVGIRMVADVFENYGWETFFLGANMPADELIEFAKSVKPDMLAISLSVYHNLFNLENLLFMIRAVFPLLPVIVGGQAFRHGGSETLLKFSNVLFISDLHLLEKFVKSGCNLGEKQNG